MRRFLAYALPVFALLVPAVASAHEVYVLSSQEIAYGLATPSFNMLDVVFQNLHQFIFWGFIAFVVVSTAFFVSIFRIFERAVDPYLAKLKRHAPLVCRVTVGIGLMAGAYYQATYGPELPLSATYGALAPFISLILMAVGGVMVLGYAVRACAVIALCFFAIGIAHNGVYMLTYTNYFGEFLVLLLLGTQSLHGVRKKSFALWSLGHRIERVVRPYEFFIIRVTFGISFLYAALYAKVLHNYLALQVAELPLAGHAYGVAHYFGFEPHFMVLGAAIIELTIGCFFVFGIEIRWTCIFLEFWLALSLWWFGESVWPHLILIGLPIAIFMHGYDRYSIEGRFFKKKQLEPVF